MSEFVPMSVGFDMPSASTRIHWREVTNANPSGSTMPVFEAVSVCPTCAVPLIVGPPVAASFTELTVMVMSYPSALSSRPSLTLNVKLA